MENIRNIVPDRTTHTLHLVVEEKTTRLDKYIANHYPLMLSRTQVQGLIIKGYVTVTGKSAKPSLRLKHGDEISIVIPPSPPLIPEPEDIPLSIVYEDDDLMVINKPPGLITHPASGHPSHTLVNAILAHCPHLSIDEPSVRPGIVHRLDKDTSGLIVAVKNNKARLSLVQQFNSRAVFKQYLVLVKGQLIPPQGTIDLPIGRDAIHRKKMSIVFGGRQAYTHYRVISYYGDYTLVEATLETGRTHQIRVHFAALGYPVAGDATYGIKTPFLTRQFVHSHSLGFLLPSSGEYREFHAELAPDLKEAIEYLSSSH